MAIHVVDEAKRCLNCKKPLCRGGCPINTPIPQMIQAFLAGNLNEAGKMLFENNPLSLVCSLICDQENQCEGHCILNRKNSPIHISSIENYISDTYLDKLRFDPKPKNGMRAGIIGSGPAGITIAILLAQRGYDITIFESKEQIGGVLRYGIPEFRLPKKILDRYKKKIQDLGIKIRPNTSVGTSFGIDDMFRDGYKAIFIGTGVWKPNSLKIKGETLGHVHYAINYLTNPNSYDLGGRVIVIGAGNSAMDVARTALRKGAQQVTVYARHNSVSANAREMEYAKIDGVNFEFCKAPVEITEEGVIFQEMQTDEDEHLVPVEGSEVLCPADSVIISISQGPKNKITSTTGGIEVTRRGLIVTNDEGSTTRPGVFASGDVVLGAKTVVEAVSYSKEVADAMDAYMQSLQEKTDSPEKSNSI